MRSGMCGKVVHLTFKSAEGQAKELAYVHGKAANEYICKQCTRAASRTIWHVGYGYDASKLSKRARRQRKQGAAHKGYKNKRVNATHGRRNRRKYDRKNYSTEEVWP